MSLPISPSALIGSLSMIRDATRIAGDVASRVGQAISRTSVQDHTGTSFDDVLRGGESNQDRAGQVAQLTDRLVESIRKRLSELGIGANHSLSVSVTVDGRLRVEQPHDRAAEIESHLNSDRQLVDEAKQLHHVSGSPRSPIALIVPSGPANSRGLTTAGNAGNILNASGGYPNW